MGMQALGQGLLGAVTGVIRNPVEGAINDGAKGFVKGVGSGLVGLIAKPTSGLAGAVAKTTEGLASDAKRLTQAGADARRPQMRVRQPRVIGADAVLLPYPRAQLLAYHPPPREPEEEEERAS